MANFSEPVTLFMSTPVYSIAETASLSQAESAMRERGITSLAAVDAEGRCSGIISATDLLRSGQRHAGGRQDAALLDSRGKSVAEVMTRGLVSVESNCSMARAAHLMLAHRVHRIFVEGNGDILGVLSTRDIMAAVEAVRVNKPVSAFMSAPVFTIRASEPVSMAAERLEKAHVRGLIVVDESGWPVGVFGQEEALDAGDVPRSTPVEKAMSSAVLTLPDHCSLHNVARQALEMRARRVAVMSKYELVGIMTGIDFAKAIEA